jgi:hypothetical protein
VLHVLVVLVILSEACRHWLAALGYILKVLSMPVTDEASHLFHVSAYMIYFPRRHIPIRRGVDDVVSDKRATPADLVHQGHGCNGVDTAGPALMYALLRFPITSSSSGHHLNKMHVVTSIKMPVRILRHPVNAPLYHALTPIRFS